MAKKKSTEKTGFRNGKLFCFNCGGSYEIQYPQPIGMATAMMTQFVKEHKHCKPTWKEPVNENAASKTVEENAKWWAENGEHGTSSIAMYNRLSRGLQIRAMGNSNGENPPSDPNDFWRCYKLLQAVPQWKERLIALMSISPVWSNLVDHWDELTALLEEQIKTGKPNGLYELMKKLGC